MISGGSSAQQSIAQYGQEGSEEIQRRSCGEGWRKGGLRGRGFPSFSRQRGSQHPVQEPCPLLFSPLGVSSLSCCTAARGQRGHVGIPRLLPRQGSWKSTHASWDAHPTPDRTEHIPGMLTAHQGQPRDHHPTLRISLGSLPHTGAEYIPRMVTLH